MRCAAPMYRVMNADQSSKATCFRCSQWTDCAKCSKCGHQNCLGCYNKELSSAGRPKEIRTEPIIDEGAGF